MLSGVINLDKPAGLTSQEAVSRVKRILRSSKAGHCGTLDPAATGVLLVCIGLATRFADHFQSRPKTYEAVLKLGESTDTQDAEGTILSQKDVSAISESDARSAVTLFVGHIRQVPPMYSALKQDGIPLHKLARKGITVEREPRDVEIYSIDIQWVRLPLVALSITCSKGVYIRTLCHDIGEKLGVGGHMQSLRRTAVGGFKSDSAVSLDKLAPSDVVPPEEALSFLAVLQLAPESLCRIQSGQPVPLPEHFLQQKRGDEKPGTIRIVRLMCGDNTFAGLGRIDGGLVFPERLLPVEHRSDGPRPITV